MGPRLVPGAIPALWRGALLWSTGPGFFCLFRLGPLCLGIAQRLVDGVELCGVGFGAHHVKGAVLSLGLHDEVGQAVL